MAPASLTHALDGFSKPPSAKADLQKTWDLWDDGVRRIMNKIDEGLTYSLYMTVYTTVYNCCTSANSTTNANLKDVDLHTKLTEYFTDYFKPKREKALALQDEALLRYYAAEWDRYNTGAKSLDGTFSYLNRYWVKRMRDEGRKTVYPIYVLALTEWKIQFFLPLQRENSTFSKAILRVIERQRNGKQIDQSLVKKVVLSFVSMSFNSIDLGKECFDVYQEHFETPFIEATEQCYKDFLTSRTLSEYLRKAGDSLGEEERIGHCLHSTTLPKLMAVCERLLISSQFEPMKQRFLELLKEANTPIEDFVLYKWCHMYTVDTLPDDSDDLQRLYALLSRTLEGLHLLQQEFEKDLKDFVLPTLSNLPSTGSASIGPTVYVEALLKVHEVVAQNFEGKGWLATSVDKFWRECVNGNVATTELIAEYMEALLSKNVMGEEDPETAFTRVMVLLKYLEDQSILTRTLLRLIERERNGGVIDRSLVKKLFVSIGLDETNPTQKYKEHFETPFIEGTKQYYKENFEAFSGSNPMSEYLEKVELLRREEKDRIEHCFHVTTSGELITMCENLLIHNHSEFMRDNFEHLLDSDQGENLQHMYAFLSHTPEDLKPFWERFEKYVEESGQSALSKLTGEVSADIDPKVYVDTLLGVHQKMSEIVARSFKGEKRFTASLDMACKVFVNSNEKSSELIAKYADMLLGKNNKSTEGELETALNHVIILFKYLENQDTFLTFYTMNMSKRLIHNRSASNKSETRMISKLKQVCGFEHTNKMEEMLRDMDSSKNLTDAFNTEHSTDNEGISFSMIVLRTHLWPLRPLTPNLAIPKDVLKIYNKFNEDYQAKHSGRKLTWLWNYSTNELRTNYLDQEYILKTSAYQMAILTQYNEHDTMSFNEISMATMIRESDILKQVLALLVEMKILIKTQDQYDLNLSFKSEKRHLNLNLPIEDEVKQESNLVSQVSKAASDDRQSTIQCNIVRIMKERKMVVHDSLVQRVIRNSHGFSPKTADIEKAIEILLEKEYIRRVDNSKNTYAYVASDKRERACN